MPKAKTSKKVLIISYYFPPCGGAGVQRTLKFVKYLPQFGWQPVVLTARNADYPAYDPSLLMEVPERMPVYKAWIFEPYSLYRKWTGRPAGEAVDIATLTLSEAERRQWPERLAEWVREAFFVPDARIGWFPFALWKGLTVVRREGIKLLYSSAPPYTCHLIGLFLKRLTGLPWVVDFRDSWIGWHSTPQRRPWLSRRLEFWMEEMVLGWADRIVTVSEGIWADLKGRHTWIRDERWQWLPNGYDAEDFQWAKPQKKDARLTFTYTGSLYGNRHPGALLKALQEVFKEQPETRDHIRFRFIGRIGRTILDELQSHTWRDVVEVIPYVSHQKCLGYLLATDVSLLIIDDAPVNRGILTGKLFEYLGAQKPILALAPEGEAANLIRDTNTGIVIPPKAIGKIKEAIFNYYMDWKKGTLERGDFRKIMEFDRRKLTQKLARILDDVAKGTL